MCDREAIRAYNIAVSKANGFYKKMEQQSGMNVLRCRVLYSLHELGLETQRQICDEFELPKQTVNNIIQSLARQGYVEAARSQRDRRARVLRLTESGKRYAAQELKPMNDMDQSIARRMGDEAFRALVSLTEAYAAAIEAEIASRQAQKE